VSVVPREREVEERKKRGAGAVNEKNGNVSAKGERAHDKERGHMI